MTVGVANGSLQTSSRAWLGLKVAPASDDLHSSNNLSELSQSSSDGVSAKKIDV